MPETVVHFQIRMPPSLHEHLSSRARLEKSSLNALIVSILQREEERSERDATGDPPGDPSSR
jgi:predicted HicB family RNase H-like nuclease